MTEPLVELEAAQDLVHACTMKGLLEASGITVVLDDGSGQGALLGMTGITNQPRLLVPASQVEEAQRILDEAWEKELPAEE